MANYDFDTIIPRRGTNSVKWDMDTDADIMQMWVADMDFRTAPPVLAALQRRVEHGILGYAQASPAYYKAIVRWFGQRHGWQLKPGWILPTTGVIPALSAILRALTSPGDKVLVQTPVYNHFFMSIDNSGCQTVESDLILSNNTYTIDFDDLERKAADPEVKLLLLCNPHNPAGRVWTPDELRRVGEICLRHDVLVIADEIHCELVMPGYRYTPFASLSEEFERRSVTCASPSKAFNLAGLQVANIFAADDAVREKIERVLEINETGMISPFAIDALTAAYDEGAEWLGALIEYLQGNYLFLREYFAHHLPQFEVLPLEGTYLVWVDCRTTGLTSEELDKRLLDEGRVRVNPGHIYGTAGEGFIRLNIACPRQMLTEGLDRLRKVLAK
ncbi:MalY/PatB family protein [uncultured Alistipes sp.]|uniref:MalY/PatB family protein n=1 Tax=uncultured Alistipes sp. TaxID=538949 RepID=UPI0025D20732|nr:MalY/PatB family protein [uncultured Alistipes sp.]